MRLSALRYLVCILFSALSLMHPVGLHSQSYLIHNYTESDGLASSMVNDVTQDSLGRMWFATRAGISMYDGLSWQTMMGKDKGEYRAFRRLKTDAKGVVWALPAETHVVFYSYFDCGWSSLNGPDIDGLQAPINFDVAYWDGIPVVAFCRYGQSLYLCQDSVWTRPLDRAGVTSPAVFDVIRYREGFLLATSEGLKYLTQSGWASLPVTEAALPDEAVTELYSERRVREMEHHRIWASGRHWMGYFEAGQWHRIDIKLSREFKALVPIVDRIKFVPDGGHGVYFQYGSIFYCASPGDSPFRLNVENGLLASGANAIFRDRERNIWFATQRGVSKLVSMRFASFRERHGLLDDEVTSIVEQRPGHFVLGHNTGLSLYDGHSFKTLPFEGVGQLPEPRARVIDMSLDGKNNIWLACNYHGLGRLSREGRFTWIAKPPQSGPIRSVAVDQQQCVWAVGSNGLFTVKQNRLHPVAWANTIKAGLRRIIIGPEGQIYLGTTARGVYVYHEDELRQFLCDTEPEANDIYTILVTKDDRRFLGTGAGLFVLTDTCIERFFWRGQSVDRPVYGLLEDGEGRLWLGTDNGLICFETDGMRHLTSNHGFAGKELNRDAFCEDSMGRLWFGSEGGVSRYEKGLDFRDCDAAPIARLLSLEVNGDKRPLDKRLSLAYHENFWICSFYGSSFIDEHAMQFRVRLEGFDEVWVEGPELSNRQIRYTNLYPGEYRFHLQAASLDGSWSPVVSSPLIVIKRPYWQTAWFFAAVLLGITVLFYLIQRFISDRRQAQTLAGLVEERTRQLAESEEKYRLIAENPIDGIALLQEGRVIWGNARLGIMFGKPVDQLTGTVLRDLIEVESQLSIDPITFRLLTPGEALHHYEARARRQEGMTWEMEVFASDEFLYTEKPTILGIFRDITESKQAYRQLRTSLKEKEVLLKEVHHRVKNNLQIISSLLSLQSRHVKNTDVLDVFLQSQNRIRTMALLHEKIYQSKDLSHINAPAYVRTLVQGLTQIYHVNPRHIQIDSEIGLESLDIDQAVPCGLIINELLSNALKYAFPGDFQGLGQIKIEMHVRDEKTELVVCDNGVGLPEGFDPQTAQSLGLKLVYILGAEQLRGQVLIDRIGGTKFTLQF